MSRILIIEDSPSEAAYLRSVLIRRHAADVAVNGVQALMLLDRQHYDLVITDILMPERDGLEIIRDLRGRSPRIPVIAMSGGGSIGNVDYLKMARMLGAAGTLVKPFDPAELHQMVDDVFSQPKVAQLATARALAAAGRRRS